MKIKKRANEWKDLDLRFVFNGNDVFYFIENYDEITGERESKKYIFQRVDRKPTLKDSLNGSWCVNLDSNNIFLIFE